MFDLSPLTTNSGGVLHEGNAHLDHASAVLAEATTAVEWILAERWLPLAGSVAGSESHAA
jgi:hypothetical protein